MGSAVLTTDAQSGSSSGARLSRRYYTAFGERVAELGEAGQPPPAWAATTFGYCGAFGYEGSAEWPTESNFGGASGGGSGGASGGGSGGSSGGGSGGSSSNDDFWESDLGVLHVGARWYWPETGRFLERDPIGILGALNTYVYSSESVLEQTDPSGLAPESIVRSHDWRFRDHREQDRSARRPVPTRYLGDPPPPPPQPPPSEVPALFPPTVWPFEFVEKGEATLILSSVGMCAAFIGDACMTVGGVPFWYDGEGGEFGYCTKRVGRTILRIWD
ncbi:MAG: RHS repeat-associated core domain-containing protein [Phycisphaerae bacterium]